MEEAKERGLDITKASSDELETFYRTTTRVTDVILFVILTKFLKGGNGCV